MENRQKYEVKSKITLYSILIYFFQILMTTFTYTDWKVVLYSNWIKGFGITKALELSWDLSSSFYCVYMGTLLNFSEILSSSMQIGSNS